LSWLIGVDVGASHIEAVAAIDPAKPMYRVRGSGAFVKPGKVASVAAAISSTIGELTQMCCPAGAPDFIVVGAAGTHNETLANALKDAICSGFPKSHIQITTDGAIALEAAFGDNSGIVVCAGSGSIAYARTPGNGIRRVGGLGPELADEGSGYAIGRAGLRAAARAADGRLPHTSLMDSIAAAVGISDLDELVDWAWEADRPTIAALSQIVCRDAVAGDETSRHIVHNAAVDLGNLIASLASFFGLIVEVDVALSGGVLSEDSPVRWELVEHLGDSIPNATVFEKSVDPVLGALAMADRTRHR